MYLSFIVLPSLNAPRNDIDVFLEPLVDELKELRELGKQTYDASKDETFALHGTLIYTTSDFPTYSNLSGWKTKGQYTCPYCNPNTSCLYLKGSTKMYYMGHRRFLPNDRKYRHSKKNIQLRKKNEAPP